MTQAVLSLASRTRFLATAGAALWGNPKLLIGLPLLLALVVFSVLGPFLIDLRLALPIWVGTNRPPSAQH